MDELFLRQMGQRIYERRKQKQLTQEKLSELSGVTPQTISTAELGKKALRPENIAKLCNALEISADFLLMGEKGEADYHNLMCKIKQLSALQYQYLESIIDIFVSAVNGEEK